MPWFPTFRRPCPYQADLAAVMDGDWCRMCGQQVHDITDLSDQERRSLLQGCKGEICVSYTVPAALAAAALAASAVPAVAADRSSHHRHAPKVKQPEPPVMVTLAGAPPPMPIEEIAPPADPSGTRTSPDPTPKPSADPRSSR